MKDAGRGWKHLIKATSKTGVQVAPSKKKLQGVELLALLQSIAKQVLQGLVFTNKMRLLHRDIKPDNITVDPPRASYDH